MIRYTERVTIRLTKGQKEALIRYAAKSAITLGEAIRKSIEQSAGKP